MGFRHQLISAGHHPVSIETYKNLDLYYPDFGRARGIHIPNKKWGAKELLRVSQLKMIVHHLEIS
jgi:hypothetical protein